MHAIDWLSSSAEQRAKLYPVAKTIKDIRRLESWNDFFALCLTGMKVYGRDYESNFRSGAISRQNAHDIYHWIAANHLETGQRLAKELFPTSKLSAWDELVAEHGQYGFLKPENPNALALSSRDDDGMEIEDDPIKLKEPYCFVLRKQAEGSAFLIECHDHQDWYPVPIGPTPRDLVASLPSDHAVMPWDNQKETPIALREHVDVGLRQFVLIHGANSLVEDIETKLQLNEAISSATLNDIATTCAKEDSSFIGLHRLNIVFVDPSSSSIKPL